MSHPLYEVVTGEGLMRPCFKARTGDVCFIFVLFFMPLIILIFSFDYVAYPYPFYLLLAEHDSAIYSEKKKLKKSYYFILASKK